MAKTQVFDSHDKLRMINYDWSMHRYRWQTYLWCSWL